MRWDGVWVPLWQPRAPMTVPPKADKWIVFISTMTLALLHYALGTSLYIACVFSIAIAVILTMMYVLWCALGRFLARRLVIDPIAGRVRTVSNVTYAALLLGAAFLPIPHFTVEIPVPVDTATSAHRGHS